VAVTDDDWEAVVARRGTTLTEALSADPGGVARPTPALDGGQRLQVVDTLATLLGGAYCHLVQKRAGYALDPVQALALLRRRCASMTDSEFHLAVTGLVTSLRDAHTRYAGPSRLHGLVAALPFLVEQCGPAADPRLLVTKVVADPELVGDDEFSEGVQLEWWNGVPAARALDIYADHETGGRPDSRRARALQSFTFRSLAYGPPPDEHWVHIGYRTPQDEEREVRIDWRVIAPETARTAVRPESRAGLRVGADLAAQSVRRAKTLLFAPRVWSAERAGRPGAAVAAGSDWLTTELPDVLAARAFAGGRWGYLRIWSFDVEDDDAFVAEVARLLAALPPHGVVVDVRGNPGGLIWAAERILQLFTDTEIHPTRFSLLASPLTRAMAASPFNRFELDAWVSSLEDAVVTGEPYAQPLPLTDPDWCNDLEGGRYPGPALLVVDSTTYSSGDLLAAGWADHDIGPVVCVGEATGAGGANVWTDAQLRDALVATPYALPPLPAGARLSMSVRRAVRSGPSDGVPIEDLGVAGMPYTMTADDLLHGNRDLLSFCARTLDQLAADRR
jgi:Peptidase family S41